MPTATSLVTTQRSSFATYFDANGVLQTAGNDVLRLDHDPVTGEPLGALIEEQRTNLLLNSDLLESQEVSVSTGEYTLSFYGTGTIDYGDGTLVGEGTNRAAVTFTPSTDTVSLSVTGTVEMAQLEAGPFPSSYIPTTSTQATRAADRVSIATSEFTFNADEGTLVVEYSTFGAPSMQHMAAEVSNPANRAAGLIECRVSNGPAFIVSVRSAGYASQATFSKPFSAGVFVNAGIAYKDDDFAGCFDGGAVQTDNSGSVTLGEVTTLGIGSQTNGASGYLNGHIKRIRYLPRRVSNSELQALTAG